MVADEGAYYTITLHTSPVCCGDAVRTLLEYHTAGHRYNIGQNEIECLIPVCPNNGFGPDRPENHFILMFVNELLEKAPEVLSESDRVKWRLQL